MNTIRFCLVKPNAAVDGSIYLAVIMGQKYVTVSLNSDPSILMTNLRKLEGTRHSTRMHFLGFTVDTFKTHLFEKS